MDLKLQRRRREDVLRAARRCFGRNGIGGTGMKELCDAAGLSPGALYRYYPSKDAIVCALVEEDIDWLVARIEALRDSVDPQAGLTRLMESICAEATTGDLVMHLEVSAEQSRNPGLRRVARQAKERCRDSLMAALAAARNEGRIHAESEPELLAEAIAALIDGWLLNGAVHGAGALRKAVPAMAEALRLLLVPGKR